MSVCLSDGNWLIEIDNAICVFCCDADHQRISLSLSLTHTHTQQSILPAAVNQGWATIWMFYFPLFIIAFPFISFHKWRFSSLVREYSNLVWTMICIFTYPLTVLVQAQKFSILKDNQKTASSPIQRILLFLSKNRRNRDKETAVNNLGQSVFFCLFAHLEWKSVNYSTLVDNDKEDII